MLATEMRMEAWMKSVRIYGGIGFCSRVWSSALLPGRALLVVHGGGTHEIIKDFIGGQMIGGRWQSRI